MPQIKIYFQKFQNFQNLEMGLASLEMFKTIGNGVPFLMAKGLAKSTNDIISRLSKY